MTVHDVGVVDTSILAALRHFNPDELPDTMLVTAVTLGELSYGPHATDDPARRAGRVAVLQLPLYTANPDDFRGVEQLVEIVGIQAKPNDF